MGPYGDNRHLYFGPGAAELFHETAVPVVLLESEKATLAVIAAAARADRRVLAIGLGGCWNWRGRVGKDVDANGKRVDVTGPLPDFHHVTWRNREAIICFDARPDASVDAARQQFARVVRRWGARTLHARLPDHERLVNGPDDLIAIHGDAALWRVLDAATEEEFARRDDRVIATSLDNIRLALYKLGITLTFDELARGGHLLWPSENLLYLSRLRP